MRRSRSRTRCSGRPTPSCAAARGGARCRRRHTATRQPHCGRVARSRLSAAPRDQRVGRQAPELVAHLHAGARTRPPARWSGSPTTRGCRCAARGDSRPPPSVRDSTPNVWPTDTARLSVRSLPSLSCGSKVPVVRENVDSNEMRSIGSSCLAPCVTGWTAASAPAPERRTSRNRRRPRAVCAVVLPTAISVAMSVWRERSDRRCVSVTRGSCRRAGDPHVDRVGRVGRVDGALGGDVERRASGRGRGGSRSSPPCISKSRSRKVTSPSSASMRPSSTGRRGRAGEVQVGARFDARHVVLDVQLARRDDAQVEHRAPRRRRPRRRGERAVERRQEVGELDVAVVEHARDVDLAANAHVLPGAVERCRGRRARLPATAARSAPTSVSVQVRSGPRLQVDAAADRERSGAHAAAELRRCARVVPASVRRPLARVIATGAPTSSAACSKAHLPADVPARRRCAARRRRRVKRPRADSIASPAARASAGRPCR